MKHLKLKLQMCEEKKPAKAQSVLLFVSFCLKWDEAANRSFTNLLMPAGTAAILLPASSRQDSTRLYQVLTAHRTTKTRNALPEPAFKIKVSTVK